MKSNRKERAARVLLAALLQSDLSIDEIQELLTDLARSKMLLYDISHLIRQTVDSPSETFPSKQSPKWPSLSTLERSILTAVKRRRTSKADLLETMLSIVPNLASNGDLSESRSAAELVKAFLSVASPNQAETLTRLFESKETDDAYLRGITRRN